MCSAEVAELGEFLEESGALTVRHLFDRRELSVTANDLLARLVEHGPMRLGAAAETVAISQSSITQLVQRLEARRLVHRLPDPADGRATVVAITAGGRRLHDRRRADARQRLAALTATLSEEESAALALAVRVALPLVRRLSAVQAESGDGLGVPVTGEAFKTMEGV
jgi:DNA-binding MarR family transcriptional regulator